PKGKVMTYGQVAELSGNQKASRAVGNILNMNADPKNIPCRLPQWAALSNLNEGCIAAPYPPVMRHNVSDPVVELITHSLRIQLEFLCSTVTIH
ncbi:MAG: MGMT family protein, partial [Woeseia sp.]|nr:MGMT family protein [Woeseia sp.]